MNPSFQNDAIRVVTHSDFKDEQVATVIGAFKKILSAAK
jgi:threonine aldolase